jgi:hypothetical protein
MMMKNLTEHFSALDTDQLTRTSGGGFAYDVGRVLRFFVKSGGGLDPIGRAYAVMDWVVNDIVNDACNG